MLLSNNSTDVKIKLWFAVYDDAGGGDGGGQSGGSGDGGGGDGGSDGDGGSGSSGSGGGTNKTFSQDDVNRFLASEKRKFKDSQQKLIDELEALKTKSNLTDTERTELEERLEAQRRELMTKEELAKKDKDKLIKEHQASTDKLTGERDTWRTRYTEATITRAITDAAVLNEAYSPEQIVFMLRPATQLVEDLDADGKPTGDFIPKVTFKDEDKDGKPVTLELTVPEAVKRMKDMEKFFNLFKGEGTGGIGSQNRGGGGKTPDLKSLAKDPAKYREARKAGKI